MIKNVYSNQRAVIWINDVLSYYVCRSDYLQIRNGVRQVSILSPSLFNVYSEIMMNEAIRDDRNGINILCGNKFETIKFVDHQAIVSGSAKILQEMLSKINCKAKKYNMKINSFI